MSYIIDPARKNPV